MFTGLIHTTESLRRVRLLAALLLAAALCFGAAAEATEPAAVWEKRTFTLNGGSYHFSVPTDWGALQGSGEKIITCAFAENEQAGMLLLSGVPMEQLKTALESQGVPMLDVLITGLTAKDTTTLENIVKLASLAGLKGVSVEDFHGRKALVFDSKEKGMPLAVAAFVEGETVFFLNMSLDGATDTARQRVLLRQVMESFGVEKGNTYVVGEQRVTVPAAWTLRGTDGDAALGWRFSTGEKRVTALACAVALKTHEKTAVITAALDPTMKNMLAQMLQKNLEAGLTQDDGLVRLYDGMRQPTPMWTAILVEKETTLLFGVAIEGDTDGATAREIVEQMARGTDAMKQKDRAVVAVVGN